MSNQFSLFPEAICNLLDLKILDLDDNQLTMLPDSIGNLQLLITLDLNDNQLTHLPETIRNLTQLKRLFLHGNDDLGIPKEILGPTWLETIKEDTNISAALAADILRFYFRTFEEVTRSLNEAKIILVGQGAVGKSSLVKRLVYGGFDEAEPMTEGIDIVPWTLALDDDKGPVQLNIWDFGGQEIMHATHQFFLTQRSLYLLVLDARKGANESNIQYWLEVIQSYAGGSPVIIVVNKSDEHAMPLDERRLQIDYKDILQGIIPTSAKTGVGINTLKAAISEQLSQMSHIRDEVPRSYFIVKQALQTSARDNDFVTQVQYEEICSSAGVVERQDQRLLLRLLHDLGNVLNFDDPADPYNLRDTNILNPEWVTGGVYKILNDRELLQAGGILDRAATQRILGSDPRYPPERHDFIIDMMRKFELCFDFPDATDQRLLVPELLNPNEPYLDWDTTHTLNFQYAYTVLPGGILPRFIVRMNDALTEPPVYWRSGVLLEIEGNPVMVRADANGNRIFIAVDGSVTSRRRALTVIRNCLKAIHASIPSLVVKERVPMPDDASILVDYEHLLLLEEKQQSTYWPEGAGDEYEVQGLLNGIEDPDQRKDERDRRQDIGNPNKKLRETEKIVEAEDPPTLDSPSLLKTLVVVVGLVIALVITVTGLAKLFDDSIPAALLLAALAVLFLYVLILYIGLATGRIDQRTFRRLSFHILDKVALRNHANANRNGD